MQQESICLRVPKTLGEKTLSLLNRLGIRDRKLEIRKDADSIYIALLGRLSNEETAMLKEQLPFSQLKECSFRVRKQSPKTLEEALENRLPQHLLALFPHGLDIVGDIAIIEIPPKLKAKETVLGNATLETHKNVKTVLAKVGNVSGLYRLRSFNVVAGEPRTRTIHREFGCEYHVDVAKAYFSPRLGHEHKRLAQLVQEDETVADLFSGVGPFSVLIGKTHPRSRVYAVDINPEAIKLLTTNVRLNRVENRVFPILGDAKQLAEERLKNTADRVIMNLPENAIDYVEAACKTTKLEGGIIHFYGFVRLPVTIENLQLKFSTAVGSAGRKVKRFLTARKIRETAPYEWQVVLDAEIH